MSSHNISLSSEKQPNQEIIESLKNEGNSTSKVEQIC